MHGTEINAICTRLGCMRARYPKVCDSACTNLVQLGDMLPTFSMCLMISCSNIRTLWETHTLCLETPSNTSWRPAVIFMLLSE